MVIALIGAATLFFVNGRGQGGASPAADRKIFHNTLPLVASPTPGLASPSTAPEPRYPPARALTLSELKLTDVDDYWDPDAHDDLPVPPVLPCSHYPTPGSARVALSTFVVGASAPTFLRDFVLTYTSDDGASAYVSRAKAAAASCGSFTSENEGMATVRLHGMPGIRIRSLGAAQTRVAQAVVFRVTYSAGAPRTVALAAVGHHVVIVVLDEENPVVISASDVLTTMLQRNGISSDDLSQAVAKEYRRQSSDRSIQVTCPKAPSLYPVGHSFACRASGYETEATAVLAVTDSDPFWRLVRFRNAVSHIGDGGPITLTP